MDASPCSDLDGFMLAIDDGIHHSEFELCDNEWEFFYRNRDTKELYDCNIENFDFREVDKYLKRIL